MSLVMHLKTLPLLDNSIGAGLYLRINLNFDQCGSFTWEGPGQDDKKDSLIEIRLRDFRVM